MLKTLDNSAVVDMINDNIKSLNSQVSGQAPSTLLDQAGQTTIAQSLKALTRAIKEALKK